LHHFLPFFFALQKKESKEKKRMARQINAINLTDYLSGAGAKTRLPVQTIAVTNVDLSYVVQDVTIEGYLLTFGDRFALAGQTVATENGLYIVDSGGSGVRAPDCETGDDISYAVFSVKLGTYAGTSWMSVAPTGTTGIVGTGNLNFKMISRFPQTVGDILYTNSANTLGVLAKPSTTSVLQMDNAGSPVWLDKSALTAGLDAKNSVRFDTIANLTGAVYAPTGGSLGTGAFTNAPLTNTYFDTSGGSFQVGDRLLVRSQTDPKQNGIYVVTVATLLGTIERAPDFYNPTTITGGAFVFVEKTLVGWVLQGQGSLTPNTDNLVWNQFTAASYYSAGTGINITGATISTDLKTNGGIEIQSNKLALNLGATSITGTLAVANGGTGASTLGANNLLLGNGTSAVQTLAPTNYKTLVVDGTTTFQNSNTIYASTYNDVNNLTQFVSESDAEPDGWLKIRSAFLDTNPVLSVVGNSSNAALSFQGKGTGAFNFLSTASTPATVRFGQTNGSNYIGLKAPTTVASNIDFTLPNTDGSSGDYLKTNGSAGLGWGTLSTTVPRDLLLLPDVVTVNSIIATKICYFSWLTARYGSSVSARILFETVVTGASAVVQVYNVTTATSLASATYASSGFQTLTFTSPSADSRLAIRVTKSGVGTNALIYSISMNIL
jgi:hypothetical protein